MSGEWLIKRRYDLIPALVEAVKADMNYERDLLKEITELRVTALSDNLTNEERVKIENKIRKDLSDILREFYETTLKPDLEIIDSERKKVNKRALTIISATVAAVILEIVLIPSGSYMLKVVLPMVTGFAGLVTTGIVSKNSCKEYKSKIIARITNFLDEGLVYTPSLMEKILEYKRKWKSRISLSFCDSMVYIAVNMNKNLFETRIFKPLADYSFMEENLRFLILLTEIVEDLNLNTRIWTKE